MTEPVGWRDVQAAVEASERRVLAAIADIRGDSDDHEKRLRVVETKVDFLRDREIGVRMVLTAIVVAFGAIATVVTIAKMLGVL